MTPLGGRIREARRNAGLSQEKLAEQIGVSRQAVTKWEAGQAAPSTENLLRLAEALHTPLETLLGTEPDSRQALAEQIYALQKAEARQGAAQVLTRCKRNLLAALCALAGWLALYLLGRIICGDFAGSSFVGWLFGTDSKYYLYGWLLTSGLFWAAMAVSVLPALFGKRRFSAVTFAVAALGIPVGEWFGPDPANAPYGHGHDGWLLWCAMFLVSVVSGAVLERLAKKGVRLRSKAGAVWLAATVMACIAVIVLRLCTRPVMTGS